MKYLTYIKNIAIFMILLVISLPIIFSEEYSLLHDANGNLIYDSETNIYRQYNELNQLIRARINNATGTILQEYIYDPIKEKIFIKDEFYTNGSLKSSTYYFDNDYVVIQNSSGTFNQTYVYQDGTLIGYEETNGQKRYILQDHKGGTHVVLNESGNSIEENLFSPFAEPLAGAKESRFSYEGKEYDSLVKDIDYHFRKYKPGVGFGQADTFIQNVYDPQSLNRYSFEKNNPQKYNDNTGHCVYEGCAVEFSFVIGFITSAATEYYLESSTGHVDYETVFTKGVVGGGYAAAYTVAAIYAGITASALFGWRAAEPYVESIAAGIGSGIEALTDAKEIEDRLKENRVVHCNTPSSESSCGKGTNNIFISDGKNPYTLPGSGTPTKFNPSNEVNNANSASLNLNPSQTGYGPNLGGYVTGQGYYTSDGHYYPTSNPTYVPPSAGGSGNAGSSHCHATGDASCNGN